MKIIIAADKFKGSLSSLQVCEAIKAGIGQTNPSASVFMFPMADGGDGFDQVLQYYWQTQNIFCDTVDPLMRPIRAVYQLRASVKTAIISVAAASGLVLLKPAEYNPMATTTYGTGLMIKHAIDGGASKILLGLGGSATNDGGIGILSALGFLLLDKEGRELAPVGGNLQHISRIIPPASWPPIEIQLAVDVNCPLFGKKGAAFVYGPQKGAAGADLLILDEGLRQFEKIIRLQTDKRLAYIPGAGAAGGIAVAMMAFFDAAMISGASMVIQASNIRESLENTNFLITGEGMLDAQSGQGKVVQQIAQLGKEHQIPVLAFCGTRKTGRYQTQKMGLSAVFQLMEKSISLQYAMDHAAELLTACSRSAMASFFSK